MLLPTLYNALWRIAPPLIRRYLRKRARKNPAHLDTRRFRGRNPRRTAAYRRTAPPLP